MTDYQMTLTESELATVAEALDSFRGVGSGTDEDNIMTVRCKIQDAWVAKNRPADAAITNFRLGH